MKKTFTLLFFAIAVICNAQTLDSFSSNDYEFTDEHEIIRPMIDYTSIFIVFNNDITESAMSDFEVGFPELKEETGHKLPWGNKKHYLLNQSRSKDQASAEDFLGHIRQNPNVKSAYPAFILNGEIAYIDNCILLNLKKEDTDAFTLAALIDKYNGTIVEEMDMIRSTTYVVDIPADVNIFSVCNELYQNNEVVFAQPNFYFSGLVDFTPNDPMLSDQWFLNQSSDADIDAFEAWDITTGSSSVAVAVIDGHGFDMNHVEMTGKYLSPYNGVLDNNDPGAVETEEKHGTPCAGLIGALTNNSTGVASVGFNIKVVPIKMGYDFGSGGTFQTNNVILTRSCEHIMTSPYDIVAVSNSYTMGTWANTAALRTAYANMRTDSRGGLGSVVLASTGNDNTFNAVGYPFHYPNVVGVGATDRYDTRSSFSNYGDSTDIAAPGTDTWTIDRTGSAGYSNNDYYEFSGTSAACPIAAGVVGLIGSAFNNYTEKQLRTKLFTSCDKIGGYSYNNSGLYPYSTWSTQVGYGRVNAFQAVLGGGSTLNPPTDLNANVSGNNVHLSWTAPGGGGGTQEELIYDNNVATGSYRYLGYSMSTRMSPSGPCQVLSIKYYTTIGSGDNQFNANIFSWSGSQPGTTVLHSSTRTALDESWVSVDISGSAINVSGDFVVGFGSFAEEAYLGYDENLNNGRSWDFNETDQTWSSWTEAYLIRAVVQYPSGKIEVLGGEIPETINLISASETHDITKQQEQNVDPLPNQFKRLLGLLGYKIYRNGTLLNSSPVSNVYYDDNGLAAGTYNFTVTAVYDEGESDPAGPVQAVVGSSTLDPPTNLGASVSGNNVNLTWTAPGGGGGTQEELIYDNNVATGSYKFPGYSMSTRMSPSGPCQVLSIKYYTTIGSGDNQFNANIFNWSGSQPGTTVLYSSTRTALDESWVSVDVSGSAINVSGDFVIGFGSFTEEAYLGYDENLNNGRSWDLNETDQTWSSWTEAYLIRAVVLYPSGKTEVLGGEIPETTNLISSSKTRSNSKQQEQNVDPLPNQFKRLLGLLGYKVYRNGTLLNSSPVSNVFYNDNGLAAGTYNYTVTAVYDEGESGAAGPVQALIGGSTLTPPSNLQGSISGSDVTLWWLGPGGGSQEELVYDNNVATGGYTFTDNTLSTHMSPSGSCQILSLKYLTTLETGDNIFYARIFNWAGTTPGNSLLFEKSANGIEGWVEIDVSMESLFMSGDFVVGFGSVNATTFIGYDADLNNGRSWDHDDMTGKWTSWSEAYLIRALVQYGDGSIAEIGGNNTITLPETNFNNPTLHRHGESTGAEVVAPIENQFENILGLLGYNLYRNDVKINASVLSTTYTNDVISGWGTYNYNVKAVYDEGESDYSNTFTIEHYFGVDELEDLDVSIFPNPANDHLYIRSGHKISGIGVYTIEGRLVISRQISDYEYRLDVGALRKGLYFIRIETDKGTAASKILIN